MAELTFRVETPLPGWAHGAVVCCERSPFIDALLDAERITLLADPESAALDQGEEPDVAVHSYRRGPDADGDGEPDVLVRAHARTRPEPH